MLLLEAEHSAPGGDENGSGGAEGGREDGYTAPQVDVPSAPSPSYRERPSNRLNGVQLLLVHYNGWPRRWDEWIRSDSPRIRLFRSRTRHGAGAQQGLARRQRQQALYEGGTGASPSVRAAFHAAPSTHIVTRGPEARRAEGVALCAAAEEELEKKAALSELRTVLRHIDHLIAAVVDDPGPEAPSSGAGEVRPPQINSNEEREILDDEEEEEEGGERADAGGISEGEDNGDEEDDKERSGYLPWQAPPTSSAQQEGSKFTASSRLDPVTRLRTLAPILDRAGRVCVSIAPHVSYLAERMAQRRINLAQGDSSNPAPSDEVRDEGENSPNLDGGRRAVSSASAQGGMVTAGNGEDIGGVVREFYSDPLSDHPDMFDFVNGMVNETPLPDAATERGGRSSRSRVTSNVSDNLTSALLAAAFGSSTDDGGGTEIDGSGPRVLRLGGGTGAGLPARGPGGIDVHVHMLVTGPGGVPSTLLGDDANRFRNLGVASTEDWVAQNQQGEPQSALNTNGGEDDDGEEEDDDDGLFSALYAETPPPASWANSQSASEIGLSDLNLHSTNDPTEDVAVVDSGAAISDEDTSASQGPSPSRRNGGTRASPRRSPLSRLFRRSRGRS